MKICIVKSTAACILQVSGMPVIVKAVDAPFLVVEIERAIMDVPRMMGGGEPTFVKQSITINAFKALFIKVSDEYVQAARMRTSEPGQTEFSDVVS
jgi:hypothetical protein